eukprot:2883497-Ditylum_brightwellii.AAC.1
MIQDTGRYTNMTDFENDLVKMMFLLVQVSPGLHEAPYLDSNEGSLLSTNQSKEAGIWLPDTLRQHGGDQQLVAPVEGSEEMVDMELEVKDRLLAIACSYPAEEDLVELPRA